MVEELKIIELAISDISKNINVCIINNQDYSKLLEELRYTLSILDKYVNGI